jgi:hypothetical protein
MLMMDDDDDDDRDGADDDVDEHEDHDHRRSIQLDGGSTILMPGASGVAGSGSTPPAFAGVSEPRRSRNREAGSRPKERSLARIFKPRTRPGCLGASPTPPAPSTRPKNKIRTFDGINGFPPRRPKRSEREPLEWLSHDAVIEAPDALAAEAEARRLWADNGEHQRFSFDDSGIDGVQVEEIAP